MKKILFIVICGLFCSCIFTYDPPKGHFNIFNKSDEAVYVHFNCGNPDSLPLNPKLELFHFFSNDNMEDAYGNPIESGFVSPEYRINAYDISSLRIWGSLKNPRLPCDENEVTLFFITERTMRSYDWEEIYKDQMFVEKVTLTKDELEKSDWKYTYSP
jgi:hypothetical protein